MSSGLKIGSGTEDSPRRGHRIRFNNKFTHEIRFALQNKRLQLGLSYSQLAEFFGSNWTTVRKWEMGPTSCCELVFRPKIEGFINGDFDNDFRDKYPVKPQEYEPPMPEAVYQCFERIAGVCTLCNGDDGIIKDLVNQVDEATRKALSDLIAKEIIDPDMLPPEEQ